MYSLAPEYSETRWIEKCSTLIGSSTAAWCLSSKCQLFRSSVPFLGHVVGREGLRCDPRKIEDILRWPVPDCLKSVRQFLGFVGYYRRFIQNFADLAEPLVALTGKDVPFVWSPACEDAFTGLRDAMVRSPILAFPTETGEYMLDTDASNFGLGGVLSQIQKWNRVRDCLLQSRSASFAAEVLHYEEGDVGGGVDVCTIPLILARSKIYITYGSQVVGVVAPI